MKQQHDASSLGALIVPISPRLYSKRSQSSLEFDPLRPLALGKTQRTCWWRIKGVPPDERCWPTLGLRPFCEKDPESELSPGPTQSTTEAGSLWPQVPQARREGALECFRKATRITTSGRILIFICPASSCIMGSVKDLKALASSLGRPSQLDGFETICGRKAHVSRRSDPIQFK